MKGLLARRPEFALQIEGLERLQQSALHCEEGGRRAGRRTGLDVDALDVGAGGLSGDAQRLGDLTTGRTAGDQCKHLELPRSESGRSGSSFAMALPCGGQHRVDRASRRPARTSPLRSAVACLGRDAPDPGEGGHVVQSAALVVLKTNVVAETSGDEPRPQHVLHRLAQSQVHG